MRALFGDSVGRVSIGVVTALVLVSASLVGDGLSARADGGLAPGMGAVSGVVTEAATGAPQADVYVHAHNVATEDEFAVTTGGDGVYAFDDTDALPPGEYVISFDFGPDNGYVPLAPQYWPGAATAQGASVVTVRAGERVDDVNAALLAAASVSGTFYGTKGTGLVVVEDAVDRETGLASIFVGSGPYTVYVPPGRTFIVSFQYVKEQGNWYWNNVTDPAHATVLSLAPGQALSGVDGSPDGLSSLASATPTITGTPAVGMTLTAKPGVWTSGTTFSYQWYASGTAVTGATSSTFTPGSAQRDKTLAVSVTGRKAGYVTASKMSASSSKVATTATPTISGSVAYGSTLTAKPGSWTSGTTFAYQWYADGKAISKATKSTLKLAAAQKAKRISVKVTGKKSGYATVAKLSAASVRVATVATPKISGTRRVGSTLTAVRGTWTAGTSFSYQWYAGGKAISKATKSTFRLTSSQRGKTVKVKVTGKKSGYATIAKTSAATARIG